MKYLAPILFSFALATTVFGGPESRDAKDIQGTWLPVKAELGGVAMKSDFLTNTVLTLEDGKYTVTVAGSPDKGTVMLDPEAKPKTMDITGSEGPNVGKKMLCIYALKGDTLTICYGLGGKARPTEFKSPEGTQNFLVTYKRKEG